MQAMNMAEEQEREQEQIGGSFWKGLLLGLGCQTAYLFAVANLPHAENRQTGYLLCGLLQLIYLYPLAMHFYKRRQEGTSYGFLAVGVLSLLLEAAWIGYAMMHGTLTGLPTF
jgi:hypothetical protein